MTKLTRNALRLTLAAAAGTVSLFVNDSMSTAQRSSLISQADARIGEPLTPGSVAGVARRQTRRAVRRNYYGYGAGGYYGAYGGYPSAYYGGYGAYAAYPYAAYPGGYYGAYRGGYYANRSHVTGRRTLVPRRY
jgi:hypothetical protein